MRTESCREWRESLGAYALGSLPAEERAAVEAHIGGCPACRAEAESLGGAARLLRRADPERVEEPAPRPSPELGERIAATIEAERAHEAGARARAGRRRRRRRLGVGLGGAAAAVAAVAVALVLVAGGGDGGPPEQHVRFTDLPQGMRIYATLEPHSYGTEIHMYVSGVRSGTLCRVFLRGRDGERMTAGTFRYRWGDDSDAVLSSALDLSRTAAIGVHAGGRTFVAPVDRAAATNNEIEEET